MERYLVDKIIIFGNGEIADLVHYYFKNDSKYEVVAFTVDDEFVTTSTFNKLPLVPFSIIEKEFPPNKFNAHVGLSYRKLNKIRSYKYYEMRKKGYRLVTYVCSKSVFWSDLVLGDNCFILENQTIQPSVKIGNNVMIWSGNHLGHGCIIEDHAYLSSHICISGHTSIGERTFIGVNSNFKDFIKVGSDVFIGMNASVTKDVPDNCVVLGAQSNILDKDKELAIRLKKKYFDI